MSLGLAIAAFAFSFLSLVASLGTLVYLLARRFSTVETKLVPVASEETQHHFENAPTWAQEPGTPAEDRTPVTLSEADYQKRMRLAALERQYEESAADLDI